MKKYSKVLKQNIEYNEKTEIVSCSDGVQYSKDEQNKIISLTDNDKRNIHKVKKLFKGVIE